MRKIIKRCLSGLLIILIVGISSQAVFSQSTALSQLENTINEILLVLNDKELKSPERIKERREKIVEIIERGFDFSEMAKRSLGKHWKTLSTDEQKEFTSLFARLIENSYITKVERYSEEKVVFLKDRTKGKYSEVDTEIVSDRVSIPIKYRLKQKENGWKVYDINIEGVSLVRNYKGQLKKIVVKESYKGLKEMLEKKLKSLEEEISSKEPKP